MKRFITLTIAIIVAIIGFCGPTTLAAGTPTIKVDSVIAKAGSSIEVPIVLSNNPGVWGLAFKIKYDHSALTVTKVKNGNVYTDGEILMSPLTNELLTFTGEYTDLASNNTKNGTLITICFDVKQTATNGKYNISFIHNNEEQFDWNTKNVAFTFVDGVVTVSGGAAATTGKSAVVATDENGDIVTTVAAPQTDASGNVVTTEAATEKVVTDIKGTEIVTPNENENDNTAIYVIIGAIVILLAAGAAVYIIKMKKQ